MNKKILFSPIGGTDPIKNFHDGSMLHICRHYLPDIVYLYLSHEMMEYHRKDNRYIDSIERLSIHLDHHFEVRLIERNGLINVQQYDIFYQDFREEIKKIENDMEKGDELLINMASGTPAMKSALLVMATLAEYRFQPIQVSTPEKSRNKGADDRDDYDIVANWELNEDNEKNAPNRCTEVKCLNLMKMLKVETIKKHIWAYDYSAALSVAKEIKEDLPDDAYRMLQIADARIRLDQSKISALLDDKKYDIYPIKEGNKQKIFEYALALQTKIAKQELADFIRGITPLVVDLLENILKKECGIRLEDCCTKNTKKDMWEWNRQKLQKMGLLEMLDSEYTNGFKKGPVYSHHIAKIISYRCHDQTLNKRINNMVNIESHVRNIAAHKIISVTDQWIKKKTDKTTQQIMDLIKYLIVRSGISVKEGYWDSYNKMNKKIEIFLRQ
jgi:CRISPR-associated protein (Cas_Csm6).